MLIDKKSLSLPKEHVSLKNHEIMSIICNCPLGAALPDVPVSDCPDSFGQIQKVVFQRLESSPGKKNEFSSDSDIKTLASWTALLEASDGTKAVVSPYIAAPNTEPGEMRTYGGGNDTPGGMEINIGRNPTAFSGKLLRQSPATIAALKQLECEGNLGVYLIDENGEIGALGDKVDAPTKYSPIPITGFFVSDKILGGYDGVDNNDISWKFAANWSDRLVRVKPTDFNALTDLKKAVE